MKKKIILSAVITFMFTTVSVQAKDCSNYKTFSHKWNMCKVGKLPGVAGSSGGEDAISSSSGSGVVSGFWNKIRTFGGKTRGAED